MEKKSPWVPTTASEDGDGTSLTPGPSTERPGSVTIRSKVKPPSGLPTPIRRAAPQPEPTAPRPTMLEGVPVQELPPTPQERAPQPTVVVITGRSMASRPDEVPITVPPIDAAGAAPGVAAAAGVSAAGPVCVGPYEVATHIARGALGSVYICRKATQADAGRLYTLKVIREHVIRKDLAVASFNHEAQVGSLFRHPNAQTVVHRGLYEGQPYLIFDYVDGGCLADMLTEETKPSPGIAAAIILDVLTALQAFHRTIDGNGRPLGLIHCDVSPENILVGVGGVARLADFGSARFTADNGDAQPFALSKPAYMPPEQFRGERLDARSDIYSTGVLLWTALTGQQPFAGETYDQTAMNVMRKKVKPPSAFGAPACFDEICSQSMSRAPEGRFMLAEAMATALRSVAVANKLIPTREEVGAWVKQAMGDELTQRWRRIDAAFSASPVAAGSGAGGARSITIDARPRAAGATTPIASATVAQRAQRPSTRPLPTLARLAMVARPRLTRRQQVIIAVSAALTFAVTVAVGLAVTSRPPARAVAASSAAPLTTSALRPAAPAATTR